MMKIIQSCDNKQNLMVFRRSYFKADQNYKENLVLSLSTLESNPLPFILFSSEAVCNAVCLNSFQICLCSRLHGCIFLTFLAVFEMFLFPCECTMADAHYVCNSLTDSNRESDEFTFTMWHWSAVVKDKREQSLKIKTSW